MKFNSLSAQRFAQVILACILCLVSSTVLASPQAAANPEFAAIDAYVTTRMKDLRIPGVAIGIVKDDQILYLRGFGIADPSRQPGTPQTPFRLASVSKTITALAIMQLVEAGDSFQVWPLVGDEFQSRHPNAQIVFDVIRSGGEPNLRALTDQQIYDSIAYELSQNQITLDSPLTADNAHAVFGGKMSGDSQGGLFPPSDNAILIDLPPTRDLPLVAQNDRLRIQVDQIAGASAIGNTKPREGGAFLILVLMFSDLDDQPITLSPAHLSLTTPGGERSKPQFINIHSAIEKLHERTIKPQHGTVGLVVFTLTAPDQFDQLMYDDGEGSRIILRLKP